MTASCHGVTAVLDSAAKVQPQGVGEGGGGGDTDSTRRKSDKKKCPMSFCTYVIRTVNPVCHKGQLYLRSVAGITVYSRVGRFLITYLLTGEVKIRIVNHLFFYIFCFVSAPKDFVFYLSNTVYYNMARICLKKIYFFEPS